MELDDLKNTWHSLDKNEKKQQQLDASKIRKAISSQYRWKLNKMVFPEVLLAGIFLYFSFLIIYAFGELETLTLQSIGVVSVLLLVTLTTARITLLLSFYKIIKPQYSPSNSLRQFAIQKIKLQRIQYVNVVLLFVLTILVGILLTKIYGEYDVTQSNTFWITITLIAFSFIYIFKKWIMKYYEQSIFQAENLLIELKS